MFTRLATPEDVTSPRLSSEDTSPLIQTYRKDPSAQIFTETTHSIGLKNRDVIALITAGLASLVSGGYVYALGTGLLKAACLTLSTAFIGATGAAALAYGLPALIIFTLVAVCCYYTWRSDNTQDPVPSHAYKPDPDSDSENSVYHPPYENTDRSPVNAPKNLAQEADTRFKEMDETTLQQILEDINEPNSSSIQSLDQLLSLSMDLESMQNKLSIEARSAYASSLAPFHEQIWIRRHDIIDKARKALEAYIHTEVAPHPERLTITPADLQDPMTNYVTQSAVAPSIKHRDAETYITAQFVTDGHRIGELRLGDQDLVVSRNPTQTRENILTQLRTFAGIELTDEDPDYPSPPSSLPIHLNIGNPELYATLQVAITQDLEKPMTDFRVKKQLEQTFTTNNIFGFIPMSWQKKKVHLEKVANDHFQVTYDYKFITINPNKPTERREQDVTLRCHITYDQENRIWVIGQPESIRKNSN